MWRTAVSPLLIEPTVLLPVCAVDLQQGLQVVVVCLHILVIHVDIIQLPLLLKYLLCGACGAQDDEVTPRGHGESCPNLTTEPRVQEPISEKKGFGHREGRRGPHTHRLHRTPLLPGSQCQPHSRRRKASTQGWCLQCQAGRHWPDNSSSTLEG